MPAQSFEASVLVASQQAADIFLLTVYLPPQYDKPKGRQTSRRCSRALSACITTKRARAH